MKFNPGLVSLSLILVAPTVFAQETDATESRSWTHESEASVVKVSGNTTTDSYAAKQKTTYQFDSNVLALSGRYLQAKFGSAETAKQWESALRYERELGNSWAAFTQQGAESDYFAGYVQRDNTDVGGKYYFIESDRENLLSEIGYRRTKTNPTVGDVKSSDSGRLYLEYSGTINDSVSGKLWVEYLANFTDSEAHLVNYEPSINVMMSQVFSLKVAYLVKFHNQTKTANENKEDTTFTTALAAKF